jgi:hypothetical protein
MKKSFFILLAIFSLVSLFMGNVSQVSADNSMNGFADSSLSPKWRTTDSENVLSTGRLDGNVIRDGMYDIVHNPAGDPYEVQGVITDKIEDHQGAINATMHIIQTIINYALGILSFIALVYLIYHGFLMLSSAGNDKQFEKGKS